MWIKNILEGNSFYFGDSVMVSLLFSAISIIIAFYCFIRYHKNRNLPPGPVGLPVFGYYLFLRKDPIKKMNEVAKKYGNVYGLYLGPKYVVFLNDWEAMTEAYSQPTALYRPTSVFGSVPYHLGIAGGNGAEWHHTRRFVSKTMKDIGLNKSDWEDLVQEEVMDLVHRISEEGEKPVQVRRVFAESFLNNMVTMILGQRLPPGHPLTEKLTRGVDAILDYSPTLGMVNYSPALRKLLEVLGIEGKNLLAEKVAEFVNFVSDTVDENIRNPIPDSEDSFIGKFLEVIQNTSSSSDSSSYITVESLKGNMMALLTGGGETTRSTIIWTLIAMADHPEEQRKVHEELDAVIGKDGSIRWKDRFRIPYTLATFLESMRWRTLVPFNTLRMASEDMNVQGYHIPKGSFITTNNWLLHNDPRYWKNPEQFLPERFLEEDGKKVNCAPDSFNPFSYGKRNCPGKLIAEMEGLLYFVILMQKFKVMPKRGDKVEHDAVLVLTYQALNAELRFIPR